MAVLLPIKAIHVGPDVSHEIVPIRPRDPTLPDSLVNRSHQNRWFLVHCLQYHRLCLSLLCPPSPIPSFSILFLRDRQSDLSIPKLMNALTHALSPTCHLIPLKFVPCRILNRRSESASDDYTRVDVFILIAKRINLLDIVLWCNKLNLSIKTKCHFQLSHQSTVYKFQFVYRDTCN